IGYGYWGPNVARNIYACKDTNLISICDLNKSRLNLVKSHYPSVKAFSDPKDLIRSKDIDTVAVVTPVFTHYELGKLVLENQKHLFMEKPFTSNVAQGEELINLAYKKNLVLMVDHTFLFTGAVRKMREIIDSGELGTLFFYDSVRVNLGLFQHDINVIWDLAPHDISIMEYVMNKKPKAVSAVGVNHFSQFEDVAYLTVYFDGKCLAHFHVNWLAPVKVRNILIGGTKKMILYDDTQPSEKIKVYDKGVEISTKEDIYETLIQYRTGDMYTPKLDTTEALTGVVNEFLSSIEEDRSPLTDGLSGLNVVKILEASEQSIKNNGKIVYL
ncbi:Gfo/Idh/MocA family oxidoreductase, partial [candidate division WOR-3 bacterium]|nr:Gfo/Idh/MocA family oxidoreductase [candidate division WOR-3 bacterium]